MTRNAPPAGGAVDAAALERELRRRVKGEVRFDDGSRALYATDASNYRQVPIGVVVPRDADDVIATVAACRAHHAPVLPRGGGTSLCGQCCNVAVVLDFSKYMNRVLEIDAQRRTARVQPGVVLDDLRGQAARHGLTFAPDPATHNHNTLGGMIGNNSCGPHSVMGGETVHNVVELDVLTYDGLRMTVGAMDDAACERVLRQGGRPAEIVDGLKRLAERYADAIRARFPPIPRRVSGFNLPRLLPENGFDLAKALVGSEGTCVVVLEARVRLVPDPKSRVLLVLGYPSVYEAGDHVPEVMEAGPIALEGIDDRLVQDMRRTHLHVEYTELLPDGGGWPLVEFGGDSPREAGDKARQLVERLRRAEQPPTAKVVEDPAQARHIWKVRESGLGATAHVPESPITWEGWRTRRCRPTGSASTCANCARCSTGMGMAAISTGTSARAACTPASTSTWRRPPGSPSSSASSTRRPCWSPAWAVRFRASTATASRRPSCCRSCSATSWCAPSPSSRRSGTRTTG